MMHQHCTEVVGGVDTHRSTHVAAVVDTTGRILATESFPATGQGYRCLLAWLNRHGTVVRVGVEGTGAYGAGLARFLAGREVEVVEVNRPNRQHRRRRGKSDTADAEAAARAALNGDANAIPKAGDGQVEGLRAAKIAHRSAIKGRTQAVLQIRDLVVTAPQGLRDQLEHLTNDQRVEVCARYRPGDLHDPEQAVKAALRSLARRVQSLTVEIDELEVMIHQLCVAANPALLGAHGVGPDTAAALLIVAGDNPERMHSEQAFAALCGASPLEASSGRTIRHRLNRGGNRQANAALWWIVIVRMATDARTKAYVDARTRDGKTKKEIIRCLQRYVAREIYHLLTNPSPAPDGADLRQQRTAAHISLQTAARALNSWPTRLSRLERGLDHSTDLANRYQQWLHDQPLDA